MKQSIPILILTLFALAAFGRQRVTLIEEFSSSTCTDCAPFTKNVLTPFFTDTAHKGKFTFVNYPVNWPGTGDPYFTADADTRINYYSVNFAPHCFFDGDSILTQKTYESLSAFTSAFTTYSTKPAKAAITARHRITDTGIAKAMVKVMVTVTPHEDISNGYLHIALVEKKTTKNAVTGGEKEFSNVMMKMVPDARGIRLSLKKDTPDSIADSARLAGTHIEQLFDLAVVTWVQVSSTKQVIQSAWSTDENPLPVPVKNHPFALTTRGDALLRRGMLLHNTENATVSIHDLTGRMLFRVTRAPPQVNLAEAKLARGCYIVSAIKDGAATYRMITVAR